MPRQYVRTYRRPRKPADAIETLTRLLEPHPGTPDIQPPSLPRERPDLRPVWLMAVVIVIALFGIAGVLTLRAHSYGQTASSGVSP
jgi:hypothetical protein